MQTVELVGVLNITPDSFSGDGLTKPAKALEIANKQFQNGASYLDVGAESTRPGATPLTPDEEWQRLQPVLNSLTSAHPGRISIDTYHPETVRRAASEIGSFIMNDVSGFNNPEMVKLAAKLQGLLIVSHFPEAMGQDIQAGHTSDHKVDSVNQVTHELLAKREQLIVAGVRPEMIILDPGIGFGKTLETNWELLTFAREVPGLPVLIGYSKKSFLGEQRMTLERNLEAGRIAVASGARYLRLHANLLAAHNKEFN